jgi:hypothetical protein
VVKERRQGDDGDEADDVTVLTTYIFSTQNSNLNLFRTLFGREPLRKFLHTQHTAIVAWASTGELTGLPTLVLSDKLAPCPGC